MTLGGQGHRVIHKVLQFDLDGNFIKEWPNAVIAATELKLNEACLYGVLNKRYKYVDKYIFMYKENYNGYESLNWYLDRKTNNRVLQFDRNANLINTWPSMTVAEKELGYNIGACLSHMIYTCHGYIFIYEYESDIINREYCEYAYTRINNTCNIPFY